MLLNPITVNSDLDPQRHEDIMMTGKSGLRQGQVWRLEWRLEVCGLPILMINATCDPAGNNIGSHKLFLFLWPAAGETQELK